jgi:hypothetical protein
MTVHEVDKRWRLPSVDRRLSEPAMSADAVSMAAATVSDTLITMINATGVIIHSNLGRAPLSTAACAIHEDTNPGEARSRGG